MMQPQTGVVHPPMPMDPQSQQAPQQQPPVPPQQFGQPPAPVAAAQQPWMMMPPPPQPQQGTVATPPTQMWPQQQPLQPQLSVPGVAGAGQQFPVAAPVTNPDEVRSLWIGDLQYWMDEKYLWDCFGPTQEVVSVKVIRNKQTLQSEGYGFIEFVSQAAAEKVLASYSGALMPSTEQTFRLNWATLGAGQKQQDDSPDHTIFVGDLAAEVTDYLLQETFRAHYQSVKGAKVITDHLTGRSKGYGFVKFGDESEQLRAMQEMNGMMCSSRPMRIGPASNKKAAGVQQKEQDIERLSFRGPGTVFS